MQKKNNNIQSILELILKVVKSLIEIISIFKKTPQNEKNQIIEKAANLIAQFEGFSDKVYKCPAGIETIGYGTTQFLKGLSTKEKKTLKITKEKARTYLIEHIKDDYNHLSKSLKEKDIDIIPPLKVALLSWLYNFGQNNFNSSTLRKIILNGECSTEDVVKQFARWNKIKQLDGTYQISKGLVNRRNKEIALFEKYKTIFIK